VEVLVVLYKSGLPLKEVFELFDKRADKYREVKGLLQKLYVHDESTDHVGGIYVFDSKENLEAFRNSDLAKSIGDAILTSLIITAIVYVIVTTVGIGLVGVRQFADSDSPLATAASVLGNPVLVPMIIFGVGVATLSVLLSDLLSSSRTVFSMARNGDFPKFLSQMKNVNPVNSVIATSAIVLTMVLTGSLVQIATLTSLTILVYYAVTNISAMKLQPEKRLFPRIVPIAGLVSCLGLAVFLPQQQWIWTILLLALGIVYAIIRKI